MPVDAGSLIHLMPLMRKKKTYYNTLPEIYGSGLLAHAQPPLGSLWTTCQWLEIYEPL